MSLLGHNLARPTLVNMEGSARIAESRDRPFHDDMRSNSRATAIRWSAGQSKAASKRKLCTDEPEGEENII